jgi:hypothetical protein
MALGAAPRGVVAMVMRQELTVTVPVFSPARHWSGSPRAVSRVPYME